MLALLCALSGMFSPVQAQRRIQYAELQSGTGMVNEKITPHRVYRPFLFAPRYCVSISRKEKKNHLFLFYAEPQVNLVALTRVRQAEAVEKNDAGGSSLEWEAGLNAGFEYRGYFGNYYIMLGLGSGPHFISATIARQANGFIFSDNFYGGFGRTFGSGISAFARVNFRHLSNAGLQEPNYGIDNVLFLLGTSVKFR